MPGIFKTFFVTIIFHLLVFTPLYAQEETTPGEAEEFSERLPGEPMTVDRLGAIIGIFDPEASREGNAFTFQMTIQDLQLNTYVITDPTADRMRIVVGIVPETALTTDLLKRIMQANFDSALDARYAIAQGNLWSTFIHPLGSLSDEEFLSGLGQTLNLVATFGSTYSSGTFVFGGGDSQGIIDELLEEYRKKTEPEI